MVEKIIFNIEQNRPDPFKVDVKQSCNFIAGAWWDVKQETIYNCWRKTTFMRDMGIVNSEDSRKGELQENKCATDLENCVRQYGELTGNEVPKDSNEYVEADNDLLVFAEATEEDILAEVTGI